MFKKLLIVCTLLALCMPGTSWAGSPDQGSGISSGPGLSGSDVNRESTGYPKSDAGTSQSGTSCGTGSDMGSSQAAPGAGPYPQEQQKSMGTSPSRGSGGKDMGSSPGSGNMPGKSY